MQDYREFTRECREAFSHIGRRIDPREAETRMNAAQIKRRRGRNMMTDEVLEYRAVAGGPKGYGPCIVEISHGAFLGNRLIGLTVFHSIFTDAENRDCDESGCFHSIHDAAERLRELDGGE